MHLQQTLPRREDGLLGQFGGFGDVSLNRLVARQLQDGGLGIPVGVVHVDMQQEAVELRLRQGVGALLLDGVLRGHDQEQRRQRVGFAADAHLAFRHGFEQGGLNFRRRPVDFVGEDQVVEHRPALEVEAALLGSVDLGAGHVARQQVRRELNPVEAAFYTFGEGLDGAGFGQPRRTLHQQVAVCEQGDQQTLDEALLADDLLLQPAF